jgi:hypothetical protein
VVSFTPRPLYSRRKSPRYPLDRRLGGPQSRSGRSRKEKNSQPPPPAGVQPPNPDRLVRSQSLHQLSYPGSPNPVTIHNYLLTRLLCSGVIRNNTPQECLRMGEKIQSGLKSVNGDAPSGKLSTVTYVVEVK